MLLLPTLVPRTAALGWKCLTDKLEYHQICAIANGTASIVLHALVCPNNELGMSVLHVLTLFDACIVHLYVNRRLQPARQYAEARKLSKLMKTSDWDTGKKLPCPRTPYHGENLEDYAEEIVTKHKLPHSQRESVRDVLIALRMKSEEQVGNFAEMARLRGTEIRFGSAVMLVHESTGYILTLTKQRAIEGSAKRVEMHPEGNHHSIFIFKPAFKTYAEGSSVSSGDLVTFQTRKSIAGSFYSLHMSRSFSSVH